MSKRRGALQSAPISRRDFLKAAGLSLGTLAGASLACGQGGQGADLRATPPPTIKPAEVSIATSASPSPILPATDTPFPSPKRVADRILVNGKIITVDADDSIAQAVAIKDGRIEAVGNEQQVRTLAGPDTDVIDLAGRAVTPGLIDAHIHFQVMGLMHG